MKRKRETQGQDDGDGDGGRVEPARTSRGSDSGSGTATTTAAAARAQPLADGGRDRLSALPHELLLRILQQLPLRAILLCQRLNRDWQRLAVDAQVWKGLYYRRWMRPLRAPVPRRRGGLGLPEFLRRRRERMEGALLRPGGGSGGVADGGPTDWKARYRLRHNWSIGAAEVRELTLGSDGEQPADGGPGRVGDGDVLLARLVDGLVVTADARDGLRAWDLKGRRCVAKCGLETTASMTPSCLGVDTASGAKDGVRVVVGFADGGFWVWRLRLDKDGEGVFESLYGHRPRRREVHGHQRLAAVAYAHPYLLTITSEQALWLYSLDEATATPPDDAGARQPRLLTSLKSHTSWPPLSLSIRPSPQSIVVSIAYALPTYLGGWSVGLQELHLTSSGSVSHSRIATAVEQGFQPLHRAPDPAQPPRASDGRGSGSSGSSSSSSSAASSGRPASLSYAHPYLLAGNRDNTLTLYLVTSDAARLEIGAGTRLWGHTSSVAGAHVGGRGRAVSISARGGELRVWELEAGLLGVVGDRSVRVRAEVKDETETETEPARRAWVEFDDEVVIVLKDGADREKALAVYDFT